MARATRIRFVREPQAGEKVVSRFTVPRPMVAVESPAELDSLPQNPAEDLFAEDLFIVVGAASPDRNDAPPPVTVEVAGTTIQWRLGRAVLEGPLSEKLLPAVVHFAFLEGGLRLMERDLLPYEATADADVAYVYEVRSAHRAEWPRLRQTLQALSRLRLCFAKAEPAMRNVGRILPPETRKTVKRLLSAADVSARLDAFDSRLEACEDLYEGAVDRIADFRWYRHGELLEIAILVLLALELIATLLGLRRH